MQLISSFTSLRHIHTTTAFLYKVTPWLSLPLNIIDQQCPPLSANNVNCWWFTSYPTQLRHFYANSPLCSLPLDIIGQWYYPWYFCDGRVTVHTSQLKASVDDSILTHAIRQQFRFAILTSCLSLFLFSFFRLLHLFNSNGIHFTWNSAIFKYYQTNCILFISLLGKLPQVFMIALLLLRHKTLWCGLQLRKLSLILAIDEGNVNTIAHKIPQNWKNGNLFHACAPLNL